eukprot:3782181-Pleurochrysis_carterae.AAC.2
MRAFRGRASTRDVHDHVAHCEGTRSEMVKKSAKLAVLDTNGIVMSCSSTRSRTKKCRRSMCFDR